MKLFPSHLFVVISFFFALFVAGCGKTDLFENESGESLREELIQAAQRHLSIISMESNKRESVFKLSDGRVIGFAKDAVPIATLGVKGFWILNGEETDKSEEEYHGDEIARLFDTKENRILNSIVEGYSDWTFYFEDDARVVLLKDLFAYDPDSIIRGVNHRGFNTKAPENTLPAYRLSRLNGFKYVETDVRFTLDGIPVLLHDEAIDRTSNGSGKVGEYTFDQLRSFDFGNWKSSEFKGTVIPTLDEFLGLCAGIGLEPNIELKEGVKEQIFEIVQKVEDFNLKGKVTYISFSKKLLCYALEKDSTARVGFLTNRVTKDVIDNAVSLRTGYNDVYIGASDHSDDAIKLCMDAGLPISIWVLNSENAILSLPKYVSGVTSDRLHAGRVFYENGGR